MKKISIYVAITIFLIILGIMIRSQDLIIFINKLGLPEFILDILHLIYFVLIEFYNIFIGIAVVLIMLRVLNIVHHRTISRLRNL